MLSKKWIHYDAALKAERQMHYPGWFELFIIKTILYFPDKIRFFCQPIIFLIRIDCFDDAFTFFYSWSPARKKRLAAPSHQIGHKMTSFDFHLFLKAYFCIKHGAFFPPVRSHWKATDESTQSVHHIKCHYLVWLIWIQPLATGMEI